ncbi:MAG TPA: cell division protein FtsZ [Syntrophorhabdaceae bacterium]|nr:cell division protein FtsZ [Syntrophorhabdaceae bacterium]HOL05656.1 cell division protein FtsZ [Syntrophorhabdaceae bacterium]HON85548.1 cell division protein FtsZ [Syntrophorhabdaceae bacterium]HPP41878.1 cell division protein FtsZ [Syntrophorhabdaceae bacterium]HRV21539.1 cell division protein FtsZ [Syntrophorhabdaceae bacterium]
MPNTFYMDESGGFSAKLKVVGVGGGGCNALNNMVDANVRGVEFIAVNTDLKSLNMCKAPIKIQIGNKLTSGLGAGADPEVGKKAALEDVEKIKEHLKGAHMVFITCGLGGGTGTGASPVIAEISKELGSLTVAIATKPFAFEGKDRMRQAEQGVAQLKTRVDSLITIPNQRLFSIGGKHMTIIEAFLKADEVLLNAVQSISDLIIGSGHVVVDFADVKTIMSERGMAIMGIGVATGENRAREAAQKAISSPLLEDISIHGARGVLINVTGDTNMTLHEVNEASTLIQEQAHEDAKIIWGLVYDDTMDGAMRITVIATGFEEKAIVDEEPIIKPVKHTGRLFRDLDEPPFIRKNITIDYKEIKSKSDNLDIDDERYDVPTFLRKQAD